MKTKFNIAGLPFLLGLLLLFGCKDYLLEDGSVPPEDTRSSGAYSDYFWYRGEKIPLNAKTDKYFVLFKSADAPTVKSLLAGTAAASAGSEDYVYAGTDMSGSGASLFEDCRWTTSGASVAAAASAPILYKAPYFTTVSGKEVGLSNLFYVKLKSETDKSILEAMAAANNVEVIGKNIYMPLWYTLACTVSSEGNALEMANLFYESGEFSAAEPDLMMDKTLAPNDPYYTYQWNFNNTGQNGGLADTDIRYSEASSLTSGSANVIVAVLDHGIQLNHPDLPNIHSQSYDTETDTSPSKIWGNHGTACAGIIGARANNGIGVAGIAPGCRLMSISNRLYVAPNATQALSNGFNFAVNNGASVISNSWGHELLVSTMLEDAISNALTKGRNGKGCVVCFASGNDNNSAVGYPARAIPDILAVGAMSPRGERKNPSSSDGESWGSNYGTELDVIAPGVLIPTTDRTGSDGYGTGDYITNFNGTSSATPHVAAVAALVLSMDPDLTVKQVNDIIESTARKVRSDLYLYGTSSSRPNGSWNVQTGYGLLDAFGAVAEAMNNRTVEYNNVIVIGDAKVVGKNINARNVKVSGNCDLVFHAREAITINKTFTVNPTGSLTLEI